MDGGAGADVFHYHAHTNAINQSTLNNRDQVLDFNRAEGDRFDFREIDARIGTSGDQPFVIATGPSVRAGGIWAESSGADWTVFLNVDGGAGDLAIDVHLASGAKSLVASDFML